MESHRIEIIKKVSDKIAECIREENNKKLFENLWMGERYSDLRLALIRESIKQAKNGKEPLLTFDEFIDVFEFCEEFPRPDWSLARDLILIRVIEQLHKNKWFSSQPELLENNQVNELQETTI